MYQFDLPHTLKNKFYRYKAKVTSDEILTDWTITTPKCTHSQVIQYEYLV